VVGVAPPHVSTALPGATPARRVTTRRVTARWGGVIVEVEELFVRWARLRGCIADSLEDPGRGGQVGAGVVLVLDMMCVRHALGPVQDPRVREPPAQLGGEPRFELGHLVAAVDELDSAEL